MERTIALELNHTFLIASSQYNFSDFVVSDAVDCNVNFELLYQRKWLSAVNVYAWLISGNVKVRLRSADVSDFWLKLHFLQKLNSSLARQQEVNHFEVILAHQSPFSIVDELNKLRLGSLHLEFKTSAKISFLIVFREKSGYSFVT